METRKLAERRFAEALKDAVAEVLDGADRAVQPVGTAVVYDAARREVYVIVQVLVRRAMEEST